MILPTGPSIIASLPLTQCSQAKTLVHLFQHTKREEVSVSAQLKDWAKYRCH